MLRSYKTEIDPTPEQKLRIHKTIGTCRFVYNFYLARNKEMYANGGKFISGNAFSVWLNNEFVPANPDCWWIKDVYQKAVKQAILNACGAFMKFFNHKAAFPRFKKKGKSDVKMYFVKNNPKDCRCERHRVNIPTLGWVRLKEKGYIPVTKDGYQISSGTVSMKAGRYYVSVLIDVPGAVPEKSDGQGIGIDLGIKDFAILSDGRKYKNINKTDKVRKLEKQLHRAQRSLSRRFEQYKKRKKKEKGEVTRQNIQKQKLKVQKLYHRIDQIRTDYVRKTIVEIVKTKPSYITIEDLNVKGMMKNRHLSKAVAAQNFYEFRRFLYHKCKWYGIELRIVDRFYPSSKRCNRCGRIKKDLRLCDRIYKCECGYVEDRDQNAAMNLRDALTYEIAKE